MSDAKSLKRKAAEAAFAELDEGLNIGIGTGSTAEEFVRVLAEHVEADFEMTGVTTSERTETLCRELGVPTKTLDEIPILDVTVDGADEIDGDLRLIKGGGGALLREKIVAFSSAKMIVIADASKKVETLGAFPLPIEVNGFGLMSTFMAIRRVAETLDLTGDIVLRKNGDQPFITDGGHLILDASFGRIPDPEALSAALRSIPGIVEHGLFIKLASVAILASEDGIERLEA
ncbi:ribose 5-phosphate isomerase protein [Fulvimarina pelagi HTCC2506]|uniref:Ribose-5-phosphate isomerase A n=2 Tax=Fulvimarina pelagi TaxID=217511 RepID=Q0G024_9HYPH|nr:ribose-5-phosphate isomerase RpiA [Fulvimarina pelagi]EAU40769.1 ribose 5-phosphate isomerase protein [Fulvimarina pelagi HTCC2506]BAT31311.1 ribose 5-phosphate isomerase [Fulvimarina pelagi]